MALQTLAVNLIARTGVFERRIKRSRRTLYDFRKSAFQMQRTLFRLGQVFAVGFGLSRAVREFAAFEQQVAKVNTMLDAGSKKYLPGYARAIARLAIQFGEGTETIAGGLYKILSAQVPADQAINVLTASMKAARAGFTDTTTAALLLTGVMNAYKMSVDKVTKVSDILFTAQVKGQTTFGEMAVALGRLTSVAAPVGVKLEELSAAIATITQAGVPTDKAITGLIQGLTTLQGKAKESVDTAEKLGIELSVAALKTYGLKGMVERLATVSDKHLKVIIGERRARLALIPLIDRQQKFLRNLEAAYNSAGNTQTAFLEATDNLAHILDKSKQALIFLARGIGETLKPAVVAIANVINDLGLALQNSSREWWAWRSGAMKGVSWVLWLLEQLPHVKIFEAIGGTAVGQMEKLSVMVRRLSDVSWEEANRQMNEFFKTLKKGADTELSISAGALPTLIETALEDAIAKLQKQVTYFDYSPLSRQIMELNKLAEGLPIEQQKLFNEQFYKFLDLATQLVDLKYGQQLAKEADRLFKATRTPMENYTNQIERLGEMLEKKAIDWELYSRGVRMARKELEGFSEAARAQAAGELKEVRLSQVNIPAMSMGLSSQNTELQKQTGLLEQINVNTREAVKEDIG